jgi:hypothetical protein
MQVFSMVVKMLHFSIMELSVPVSDDFLMLQKMYCWNYPVDWTHFPNISLSLAHSDNSYFVLELPPQVCSSPYTNYTYQNIHRT